MSKEILLNDRLWFEKHPSAVVRFRRQQLGEFAPLKTYAEEPPIFRPSFSNASDEPLTWVAIVDVFQLLQDCNAGLNGTRLRLRMRTIPLHRAQQRAQARKELMHAVAKELLEQSLMTEAMNEEWNAA